MAEDSGVPQLEALFATESVGVALLDSKLRYLRMNPTYAELRRCALEEQLGRTLDDEEDPTPGPIIRPLLERALAGERIVGHVLEGAGYHMVIDLLPAPSGVCSCSEFKASSVGKPNAP